MNHIILFDLDGTLTDPKEGITKSVQHALQAYGIDEPDLDKLCPFIGPPLSDSFKEYYGFSEAQAREAIGYFHEYFTKQGMFENKVYPGIREMLTRLKDAGLTLAVATSKPEPFAIQILEHFDLLSYFTLVGGADMEEIRVRKGDVIAYTLDRLGTTPEESKVTWWATGNTILSGRMKISSHVRRCCMDMVPGKSLRKMGQTTRLRRWKSWEIS